MKLRALWLIAVLAPSAWAQTTPTPTPPTPPQPTTPTTTTPTPQPTPTPTPQSTLTPAPPPTPTPQPTLTPEPTPPPTPQPTLTPKPTTPTQPTTPAALITDEEEGTPKLSMPTEADRLAWRRPGFRLGLGLTYGEFHGLRGAPSGRLLGPTLRVGLRLDEDWSVLASFEYASASRANGLSGLRFAGTIDPTWHVTPALSLAIGFGFGGIVESGSTRMDATPFPSEIESSYTFPDASHPIASCSGVGAATLIRGEYAFVLGPRSELSIAAEAIGQWTGCVDDSGRFEPDTGKTIERRQWWPHAGGTLTVGITWR